jgi:hypothetical protein
LPDLDQTGTILNKISSIPTLLSPAEILRVGTNRIASAIRQSQKYANYN